MEHARQIPLAGKLRAENLLDPAEHDSRLAANLRDRMARAAMSLRGNGSPAAVGRAGILRAVVALNGPLSISVGYAAIGAASVLAGTALALSRPLSCRERSLAHHAAAGTVLAGLVVDVLAKLLARPNPLLASTVGMVLGLAGMLVIRAYAGSQEEEDSIGTLVVTIITDILVDGVLIGLSAALGASTGLLFAIALVPEVGLLGRTAATRFAGRWPPARLLLIALGIGAGITACGALGWLVSRTNPAIGTGVLAIGASVNVYLIMEELLRDAHETDLGAWEVAVLFGAFMPFFLAGIALK